MMLLLLLPMTLTGLLGCASSGRSDGEVIDGTATLLLLQIPPMPEAPEFPTGLDWGYDTETGLFTLDGTGVDILLDFRDNLYGETDTRGFLFELETWRLQYDSVVDRIVELGL